MASSDSTITRLRIEINKDCAHNRKIVGSTRSKTTPQRPSVTPSIVKGGFAAHVASLKRDLLGDCELLEKLTVKQFCLKKRNRSMGNITRNAHSKTAEKLDMKIGQ